MKTKTKTILYAAVGAAFAGFSAAALWPGLAVRQYTETSAKLSSPIRLLVVSDLHSTLYGDAQEPLLQAIRAQKPDVILLPGDITDDKVPHKGAKLLLKAIGRDYPCYYVTGNHELWTRETDAVKTWLSAHGITVLEGATQLFSVRGQAIRLGGVGDPAGPDGTYIDPKNPTGWKTALRSCKSQLDGTTYSVLLSHRPERVKGYARCGFDLVVAGHAHGGQVRIPGLLNGLLAPNQGLFPKYAGGRYPLGNTTMIVSRGLAKSWIPRVFNPPELVTIDLLPDAQPDPDTVQ